MVFLVLCESTVRKVQCIFHKVLPVFVYYYYTHKDPTYGEALCQLLNCPKLPYLPCYLW